MKVVLSWLRELCPTDRSAEELAELLTSKGAEVEAIERPWERVSGVVVARVIEVRDHPNSDTLCLARVQTGSGELEVVVGVRNMAPGDLVPLAPPGASVVTLPEPLGAREIRGVVSNGMLCAPDELGISASHDGILVLPNDLEPGADVVKAFGLDDAVLDIEVTPNRPDFLSVLGIAREVSAATGTPLSYPDTHVEEDPEPAEGVATLEVADLERCPRYLARIIRERAARALADRGAGASVRGRHAPDLGGRRRHELRDARGRAAAASVRPGAPEGSRHRGPPRPSGGDAGDARRGRADVHRRRPADLRCRASRGRGRRDGRRARRGVRADERRAARGRVVRTRGRPAHAPADRPVDRGVDAVRARRRPRGRAGRRRPGVPPDGGVVRRPRAPRRDRGRRGSAPAPDRAPELARLGADRVPGVDRGCGGGVRAARDRHRDRRRRDDPRRGPRIPGRPRARGGPDRGGRADPGVRAGRLHAPGDHAAGRAAADLRLPNPGPRRLATRRSARGRG